jgi:histone acetyltransferase
MSEFTREALGEIYSDYMDQIKEPINFQMIKQKMIKHEYKMPVEFIRDMNLTFDNCLEYNMEGSLYYKHAKKLKKKL